MRTQKHRKSALRIVLITICAVSVSIAQPLPEELASRAAQFSAYAAASHPAFNPSADDLEKCIADLLPFLGAANLTDREPGQQAFERLADYVGAPGRESLRAIFNKVAARHLASHCPVAARLWILRQLGMVGDPGCFPEIANGLHDAEPLVREATRRALQQMGLPECLNALNNALPTAANPAEKIAIINALATFSPPPVRTIAPFTADSDLDVSIAAIHALARCQDIEATMPLYALHKDSDLDPRKKLATQTALLRLAEDYWSFGNRERAESIQKFMLAGPALPPLRAAILQARFSVVQAGYIPDLFANVETDNADFLRKTAARMLVEVPGEIGARIAKRMLKDDSKARALYLEVLAERGEVSQVPVVEAQLLIATNEAVRIAAILALGRLGDEKQVGTLAKWAAHDEKPIRDAARAALVGLRGDKTNLQLVQSAKAGAPAERAECIRAIEKRACDKPIDDLLVWAADPQAIVAQTAFDALATLGSERDAVRILAALIAAPDEVAARAESAFTKLAMRNADIELRAQPVIAAIPSAPTLAQSRLIRVLGRLGGPSALAAIRSAAASTEDAIADAAIRSLSEWPDAAVLPDLKAFAESAKSAAHRVLALRGLVRLLRQPGERSADESLSWIETAMTLAAPLNERKLVLSAIGDVKHQKSLALARSLMSEESLAPEAAMAALRVARGLAIENAADAAATIAQVRANPKCGATAMQAADQLAALIESRRGFLTHWEFSGPWSIKDAKVAQIYETAFPPEPGAPTTTQVAAPTNADWQALTAHSPDDPWQFDLTRLTKDGNCCVYVRTMIHANGASSATLEIGSDDGVMVWLNRKLVHTNKVARALTVGEDKVSVALQAGENALLLKIVQGDGGCGFCCALKSPDGKPISSE